MSLNDGKMGQQDLYLTSDLALAAYLLMRGFELLGAVDTGNHRKEFGLTHTDPRVLSDMEHHVVRLANEFENLWLPIPDEPDFRVNFKVYMRKTKELHHALDQPVVRSL